MSWMLAWQTLSDATVSGPEVAVVMGAAAVMWGLLGWAGVWRPGTLGRAPRRELGVGRWDLVAAGVVFALIGSDKVAVDGLQNAAGWWRLSPTVEAALRQLSQAGVLAGLFYFFCKAALSEAGWRRSGVVPRRPLRDLVYGGAGVVVGFITTAAVLMATNLIATWFEDPSPPVNHGVLTQMHELQAQGRWDVILGLMLSAIVIGPLLEEVLFRGLLQTWLLTVFGRSGAGRWATLGVAAALFGLTHLGATSWHALPGLMALGLVLGWLYERTGSLWPGVLAHAGFNVINVAMVLSGVGV